MGTDICTITGQALKPTEQLYSRELKPQENNLYWCARIFLISMGTTRTQSFSDPNLQPDFDVRIIGAGLSGIYSLYRMRELGLRTSMVEAGGGEGGTWDW